VRWFFRCLCFTLMAQSAGAHEGWGVVSDPRGRIFFTDTTRNIVWRLDPDGTRVAVLEHMHAHALVTIGDGSVYGAHADTSEPVGSVWRLDPDGRAHTLVPPTRDLPLGLRSFLIDADGTIYSAIGWAPAGRVLLLRRRRDGIAERVAEGFTGIDGMAWAPDGAILLTDGPFLKRVTVSARNDTGVNAHARRTGTGGQAGDAANEAVGAVEVLGGGPLTRPRGDADLMGVTTDGSGGAFVADFSGGRVLAVGRGSGVALEYASTFPWSPTGVARDASGLVVLERLVMPWSWLGDLQVGPYLRVRRLGLTGGVVTLEVLWGTRTWMAAAGLAVCVAGAIGWRLRRYHRQPVRPAHK
jgi:hypothetical protein